MRYDGKTIVLHWLTAGLVVSLWVIAKVIDDFASGWPRVTVRSVHITLGVCLAVVLVVRLAWRFGGGVKLPAAEAGVAGLLARAVHGVLYLLVIAVVLGGVANVWVRGDSIFGLFQVPAFAPGDRALRRLVGGWHELGANAILILAGLHAAAALVHHYVRRDGVLRRMLPSW